MDEWTQPLTRVLVVANRKGGVLKTSLCRNVAAVAQEHGYRVLAIDGDPQGNLSQIDFGAEGDRGRNLAMALQYGTDLEPVTLKGVDVIGGGAELRGAVGAAAVPGSEVALDRNLRSSLGRLCAQQRYDLVLVDSGPGDTHLVEAYLRSSRWLVVPTISDEASFAGVDQMGALYVATKRAGADVEFLGAVLTKVNPQATARNASIRAELAEMLGESATPFETMIRYEPSGSVDARRYGLSAREVAVEAVAQRKSRIAALRERAKGVSHRSPQDQWWSRGGDRLAQDYEELTREILSRISRREEAAASA